MDRTEGRLLNPDEVAEIRQGVKDGIRGPVMLKWVEMLLIDHDERVRRERARLVASVPAPPADDAKVEQKPSED